MSNTKKAHQIRIIQTFITSLPYPGLPDGHKLAWAAACLVSGILLHEHVPASYLGFLFAGGAGLALILFALRWFSLCAGVIAGLAGLLACEVEIRRADHVMLQQPVTADISGIIEARAVRRADRLTLTLTDIRSDDTRLASLNKVRFSTARDQQQFLPGDRIDARVRLFPLSPPAFAGRPDYARNQFMSGLSATGFAYQIQLVQAQADKSWVMRLDRWRHQFAARLTSLMGTPYGGLAAALLVGIRDDIDTAVYDQFRASGLAHLLAISGLHMGLFCLSVLLAIRTGFACFPSLCQRWSPRRLAAITALLSGFAYLLISGGPVSAIRAFVMAVIILLAVLVDRPAFTLRNLALAAFCLLLISPSFVYTAGFQLSFIASFAIIAGLEGVRPYTAVNQPMNRILRGLLLILFTSILASFVTIPFIAYHFGQFTLWGIFANLVALPLTAFLIMPTGILVLLTVPFGLSAFAETVMLWPLMGLLKTAEFFASLPFAGMFFAPPPAYLSVVVFWGLLFFLTPQRFCRYAGLGGLMLSALLWAGQPAYHIALFHMRGPVLAVTNTSSDTIETSKAVSQWWQDNLRLSLGREQVSHTPGDRLSDIQLVTQRGRLSMACDSQARVIITLAEPLYPCRSGVPIIWVPASGNGRHNQRESWLFYLPDKGRSGDIPPPVSNRRRPIRPWRINDNDHGRVNSDE